MLDEMFCDKVHVDPSYLKDQPPPPMESKDLGLDQSLNKSKVVLGAEILNILSINEVSSMIELQYKLILTWRDPRLHFIDLKEHTHQNVLSPSEAKSIWYPRLVLVNTIDKAQTIVSIISLFVMKLKFKIC